MEESSALLRLRAHLETRPDYRVFVSTVDTLRPKWQAVSEYSASSLYLATDVAVDLSLVKAFVIAYPNRQLLDSCPPGVLLPVGIEGISRHSDPQEDFLTLDDLVDGCEFLEITYGKSTRRPDEPHHYSTALKNISGSRIRILRFAGYTPTQNGYELNTVTGRFFSAEEFASWYGVGDSDGWIEPGSSVADPDNYGGRPVLWAYYCETESGLSFVAGKVLRRLDRNLRHRPKETLMADGGNGMRNAGDGSQTRPRRRKLKRRIQTQTNIVSLTPVFFTIGILIAVLILLFGLVRCISTVRFFH